MASSDRRSQNWRDRLPEEIRTILQEIKDNWKDGAFRSSALALARSIQQKLHEEGYETVGAGEIRRWLAEN